MARAQGLIQACTAAVAYCRVLIHEMDNWRKEALLTLAVVGDASTLPPLAALSRDPDADERKQARHTVRPNDICNGNVPKALGARWCSRRGLPCQRHGAPPCLRPQAFICVPHTLFACFTHRVLAIASPDADSKSRRAPEKGKMGKSAPRLCVCAIAPRVSLAS